MDAVYDVAEAPLVRTSTLSTAPMKGDLVDVLAIDLSLLLGLLEELFSMACRTLFSATLHRLYLLTGWRVVIRTFSIRSSNLLVEEHQLDIDLLVLQHLALHSFFDFFPTAFVVNLDRKAVGNASSF